jgi:hypothetical protein
MRKQPKNPEAVGNGGNGAVPEVDKSLLTRAKARMSREDVIRRLLGEKTSVLSCSDGARG